MTHRPKPNVIWIYCDELRADAVGCWEPGTMRVPTPSLDRLASMGTRFNNCFCNSPVCVPSRMSTLTARPPEQTGVYNNEGAWPVFELPVKVASFPEWFAASGYRTADFGKMHLPPGMNPWQLRNDAGGGMGEISQHLPKPKPDIQLGAPFPAGVPFPAQQVTDNALAYIQQATAPYLLRVSYLQPHTPLFPPPPFDTLFADGVFEDVPLEKKRLSRIELQWSEIWRARGYTAEQWRRARGYYSGLVAWMDQQVGRILDLLESRGELDHTIIVFASDHGTSKGENGCGEKHIYAPYVHRVPLMVSCPAGGVPRGEVRHDLAQNMDLARTLCGLAGIEPSTEFCGRSLFTDPEPEAIFSTIGYGFDTSRAAPNGNMGQWHDGRGWPRRSCIRTKQYRLDMNTRIDGGPASGKDLDIFLADVQSDPQEHTNIADHPAYRETVARLVSRLQAHGSNAVEVDQKCVLRPSHW